MKTKTTLIVVSILILTVLIANYSDASLKKKVKQKIRLVSQSIGDAQLKDNAISNPRVIANDLIASDKIKNGTIKNEDIAIDAKIDSSKLDLTEIPNPVDNQDVASKEYVDNQLSVNINNLRWKDPVSSQNDLGDCNSQENGVARLVKNDNWIYRCDSTDSNWHKVSNVATVNHNDLQNRNATSSHPSSSISFTPQGEISANNLQAAINELDTEKLALVPSGVQTINYQSASGSTILKMNVSQSASPFKITNSNDSSVFEVNNSGDVTANSYQRSCPQGYIWVPGMAKFGTLPGFCVMKYEAKCDDTGDGKGDTTGENVTYRTWSDNTYPCTAENNRNLVSSPEGSPMGFASQKTAITYCQNIGIGHHLITENEWMTLAEQIMELPINDTDSDASLQLAIGHSDGLTPPSLKSTTGADPVVSGCNLMKSMEDDSNAYVPGSCEIRGDGTYGGDDNDKGYYATGDNWNTTGYGGSGTVPGKGQLRTFVLPNRQIIWDMSGNSLEFTDQTAIAQELPEDATPANDMLEYNAVTKFKSFYYLRPHNNTWTTANGIGNIYSTVADGTNLRVFIRAAQWFSGSTSGILGLFTNMTPDDTHGHFGFRCAK